MAVQVVAGSVVAHRGPRVSVARGDLDVSEVDAGIEHGRVKRPGFAGGYEALASGMIIV